MAQPGRKPDAFELLDGTLRARLRVVLDAWPELHPKFASNKLIGVAMAQAWDPQGRQGPQQSTISTKLNNNSRITARFVECLHASLPISTADVANWKLPMDEFRAFVRNERSTSARSLFQRIAGTAIALEIGQRDALLGLGRRDLPMPEFEIGSSQHLTVTLPMDGYLTVINFGPDAHGQPEYLWLDPSLGTSNRKLAAGRIVVPEAERGLPVGGPAFPYTLIAIVTNLPIDMLEACSLPAMPDGAQAFSERAARDLFSVVQSRSPAGRAVGILEYRAIDRKA